MRNICSNILLITLSRPVRVKEFSRFSSNGHSNWFEVSMARSLKAMNICIEGWLMFRRIVCSISKCSFACRFYFRNLVFLNLESIGCLGSILAFLCIFCGPFWFHPGKKQSLWQEKYFHQFIAQLLNLNLRPTQTIYF